METYEVLALATEAQSTDNTLTLNRYTTIWKDMVQTIEPLRSLQYDSMDLSPLMTRTKPSLHEDSVAAERKDIARATDKPREEAQIHEVQLSMADADIQDFVNRPA
jgi:hypothetical protein